MEEIVFRELMELCRARRFVDARQKYWDFVAAEEGRDTSARYISWLAKIEGMSGNIDEEILLLENVLVVDPDYYSANFMKARAQIKLNRYEAAIKSGKSVLSYEYKFDKKPFSKSAGYLVAFASMKLCYEVDFYDHVNKFDEDHTEWLDGRLWSKKDLIDIFEKMRPQGP